MNTPGILVAAVLAANIAVAACAAPSVGSRPLEKPNILILVADDLGYGDIGINGGTTIKTPSVDRLFTAGVKLNDFRACPMCSPTRAGLMTGRWPLRFGVMRSVIPPWSTNGVPPGERTIAELLARAGYERRGIIGKWHLGHANRQMLPLAKGFTSFYGHYNGAIGYFDHLREGQTDWHRDFDTVKEEGYSTDLLCAEAVGFIESAPAGKPWFLYVPFNAPHAPFEAKPEDMAKYPQLKGQERKYAAMVDCLDQAIGKILSAVEKKPDAQNTIVLFFSDNGGVPKVGSNAPWRGGKLSVYEGGTRVAAAIRWPAGRLPGGTTFEGRIGYIDVVPTMLAAAGANVPENLDGINFLPALRKEAALPNRKWFSYVHQAREAHASVHEGKWKLVAHGEFFEEQPGTPPALELYDLEADPKESSNVASANPEVARKLSKALKDFGRLAKPGEEDYEFGREGFKAPEDWVIK